MKERIVLTAGFTAFLVMIFFAGYSQQRKDTVLRNGQLMTGTHANKEEISKAKNTPMKEGVIIEGDIITYIGDGFRIETSNETDEIKKLWYNEKLIGPSSYKQYADRTTAVIRKQRDIFEKEVENLTPGNGNDKSASDTTDKPDAPDERGNGNQTVSGGQSSLKITTAMRNEGYKLNEGNAVRYFLREYEVVTTDGKKVSALYINNQRVPDDQLAAHTSTANRIIEEVQQLINKRVNQWFKRVKNYQQ